MAGRFASALRRLADRIGGREDASVVYFNEGITAASRVASDRRERWHLERARHVHNECMTSPWVRFGTKAVEAGETAQAIEALRRLS